MAEKNFSKVLERLDSELSELKTGPEKWHSRYSYKNESHSNLLIHNASFIFTCDENEKIQILKNHSIVIEKERIKDVLPASDVDIDSYDMVYDAGKRGGLVITPGLINTHAHPPMYLMRSIMTLEEGEGLEETIALMPKWERAMNDVDYAVSTIGDFTEQQRYGITTTLSHYGVFLPIEHAARVTKHNVINALSAVSNTHPENTPELIEEILARKESFVSNVAVALHYLYKANDDVLKKVSRITNDNDLIFTCHMAESQSAVDNCIKEHGIREVPVLKKYNLLREGTITSHSIYVEDEDIQDLIKGGVGISHLPTSNVIHKSGRFPFWKFVDNDGFRNISLGTDGVVSKSRVDLLSEAYQTRITHLYERSVKFGSLFKMLTSNGANVLRLKDKGKILPGFVADLAIWKLKDIGFMPYDENNPITLMSNLITHGGRPVRDLVIGGQFVIKDRRHQFVDEGKLLGFLQEAHMRMRKIVDNS